MSSSSSSADLLPINKYYLVLKGYVPGIYSIWEQAQKQTKRFANCKHFALRCTIRHAHELMHIEFGQPAEQGVWEDFTGENTSTWDAAVHRNYYNQVLEADREQQQATDEQNVVKYNTEPFIDSLFYKGYKKDGEQASEQPEVAFILQNLQWAITQRDHRQSQRQFEERGQLDEDIDIQLAEEIEDASDVYRTLLENIDDRTFHATETREYIDRRNYRAKRVKAAYEYRHNLGTYWYNDCIDAQRSLTDDLVTAKGEITANNIDLPPTRSVYIDSPGLLHRDYERAKEEKEREHEGVNEERTVSEIEGEIKELKRLQLSSRSSQREQKEEAESGEADSADVYLDQETGLHTDGKNWFYNAQDERYRDIYSDDPNYEVKKAEHKLDEKQIAAEALKKQQETWREDDKAKAIKKDRRRRAAEQKQNGQEQKRQLKGREVPRTNAVGDEFPLGVGVYSPSKTLENLELCHPSGNKKAKREKKAAVEKGEEQFATPPSSPEFELLSEKEKEEQTGKLDHGSRWC